MERGIPIRTGAEHLRKNLPAILEDAGNGLTPSSRRLLSELREELQQLDGKLVEVTKEIGRSAREDEGCRRLDEIPGIGPIISTALTAAVGNGSGFRKGRDMAAWLGLVPRQHSSGGKPTLLGISKRAIATCAPCSSKAPAACSRGCTEASTPSVVGWINWNTESHPTWRWWLWPTSW